MNAPFTDQDRVLTTDEARQGETHLYVRYVLAFGIILAMIALALVYALYG